LTLARGCSYLDHFRQKRTREIHRPRVATRENIPVCVFNLYAYAEYTPVQYVTLTCTQSLKVETSAPFLIQYVTLTCTQLKTPPLHFLKRAESPSTRPPSPKSRGEAAAQRKSAPKESQLETARLSLRSILITHVLHSSDKS
jgi:hypothetical protein